MNPIKVLLADEQNLIRIGLKSLLSDKRQFDIIGEASDEEELMAFLLRENPDVIIFDYNQPASFSLDTISRIKEKVPGAKLLVISADNNKEHIFKALESGVNSFLTKTCGEEEIYDAVFSTAKGEKFFCTKVLDYLLEKTFSKGEENCAPTPLSSREIEIVRLVAKGYIAKEIAHMLNLSPHTVYTHRKNIMRKLKLNTSTELVLYAFNNGMIDH